MKIGILSDTHGNVARTEQAAKLLLSHDAKTIMHCGDIGSEAVLIELASNFSPHQIPVYAVLGNVDLYDESLPEFPEASGISVLGRQASITIDELSFAIIHGDDGRNLNHSIRSGKYNYIFTGHTHEANDQTFGSTRVINPGAVHRANVPSVAILETSSGELSFYKL